MPSLLARYARPLWWRALLLLLLLVVGSGLQLAGPHLVRYVIDGALGDAPLKSLVIAAAFFLLVGVANIAVAAGSTHVGAEVGWRATNRLRADLLREVLGRELSFHENQTPGELIERLDSDPSALLRFFSSFVLSVVGNAIVLIGALVVLYRQRWWLGVSAAIFAIVMVLLLARLRASAAPHYRESREATTQQMAFVTERLGGIDDIRANGAVEYTMGGFLEVAQRAYRSARTARMAGDALGATGSTLLKLGTLGALGAGIYLHQRSAATVGTVYLIVQYADMLSRPLNAASGQADQLQQAKVAAERVAELLPADEPPPDPGGALPAGPLRIEAEGVTFRYGDGPAVLTDVTFAVAAGETLAVVGRTGAGKTTLARLLFGLDRPTSGSVRLAGCDTKETSFEAIRSRASLVTQQVHLLHGTLRDNLTVFDPSVDDRHLRGVIRALALDSWFERLPDGLDTVIDPRGAEGIGLSAGEAQLVALGRIFRADPGLVVLDEASSRVDPLTEQALDAAVQRLVEGRTAVVIAHRLTTIRRADSVLVLEGGMVVEHGSRAALEGDPSSRLSALLRTGVAM